MSILVVGAGGQVGRELVQRAGSRRLSGVDRAGLDITDAAAVVQAIRRSSARVVINAAAYTAVDKAERETAAAFAANRDGPATLARACAEAGAVLLHLSTDYVFDGSAAQAYQEHDPAAPLGVYGQSKWEGEQAIRAASPQHLILRVAWVFGAHGNNFVRTMLRLGRERDTLRVVADQRGAPTHAGAIAEVLLELADRVLGGEVLPWGTYHYTGAPVTTWHGFAEAIFDEALAAEMITRKPQVEPITTDEYPTPARRPANSALDMTQLGAQLGITAAPWRDGLRETLQQWRAS